MNFRVNADQQALQEGLRSFCQGRVPVERLRELEAGGGFDRALWSELAEMGVFALRLDEAQGGVGLGSADAVLVFEELGRALVPGPILWSHLAAGLVDGAADGSAVVGGLDLLAGAGQPLLVEHLDACDALLVLRPEGVYRLEARALEAQPVALPLDPLSPVHALSALPEGERLAGPEDAARLWRDGAALAAGLLLGNAEATLQLSIDYAQKREQFGRPIGSFQAIKHMIADMFVRQEMARSAAWAAGATLDDPEVGDPIRAVASGKIVAGEAALKNARAAIQVYGGMGYTWEVPVHYYLKRAFVLESVFGTAEEHADRAAERVGEAA